MNNPAVYTDKLQQLPRPLLQATPTPRRMLCIWLPDWPIQRLVVARPELRRQQVILYWQHPQRGQLVAVASPRAQLDGVCRDMPLAEARSLLQISSPSSLQSLLHEELHQPDVDRVALIELALTCETFSPVVAIEQAGQPSSIFLDISGLGHLFGGEHSLIRQVQAHFESGGYYPRLGVAGTIGMAWACSRFPECDLPSLPVEALRLPLATLETLQQLGIQRVGQLLQLPRTAVHTRLGGEVGQRLDELTGEREEVLNALHPPAERTAHQFLDYPLSHWATIDVIVERLISQLCRQLTEMRRGALQWRVELSGPDQPALLVMVDLFQPTAIPKHVMQLFKMRVEDFINSRRHATTTRHATAGNQHFAVQEVTVSVQRSVMLIDRQRQLFDEPPRPDRTALAHLINRLASHLGSTQVLQPRLLPSAQAEYAARLVPLVGPGADREQTAVPKQQIQQINRKLTRPRRQKHFSQAMAQPAAQNRNPTSTRRLLQHLAPLDRPLRLYAQPIELQAVSSLNNPPALLIGKQQRLRVMRAWGPERIESGWWRGPSVRRDYWRVELEDGRWLWVYRDLKTRGWFLHGEF